MFVRLDAQQKLDVNTGEKWGSLTVNYIKSHGNDSIPRLKLKQTKKSF